jgi:protein-tyrosine-phosphatase
MKVLFVCSGNAHRSPLAEALLRKLRPDLQVDSAGLHVVIPISEEVRDYLAKEDANQFLKKSPESLTNKHLRDYDLIVSMQQIHKDAILDICPECESKIVVWNIEDPYFMPPEDAHKVNDLIKENVKELAKNLQTSAR